MYARHHFNIKTLLYTSKNELGVLKKGPHALFHSLSKEMNQSFSEDSKGFSIMIFPLLASSRMA